MPDKCEVFEIIKSVITSKKGGVLLKDINRDYRDFAGDNIPYKNLGYRSIGELLDDIPEIHSFINGDGETVFVNKGKNCEHLVGLISKQKGTINKSHNKARPKQWRPRYTGKGKRQTGTRTYSQDKDYSVTSTMNSNFGVERRRLNESTNSEKTLRRSFFAQGSYYHPRNIRDYHSGDEIQSCEESFDESPQSSHYQNFTDSSKKYHTYKSSNLIGRKETYCNVDKHEPRYRSTTTLENAPRFSEHCGVTLHSTMIGHESHSSSSRSNHFNSIRPKFLEKYLSRLHINDDHGSAVVMKSHEYYKYPKYSQDESSRCAPEFSDWDMKSYRNYRYGCYPEINRKAWTKENYGHKYSNRQVYMTNGNLRVTIGNNQ